MGKALVIGIIALLLVLGVGFVLFFKQSPSASTGNAISVAADGTVIVALSSTPTGQYEPAEIKVKQGTKVRIQGDPKTLAGGMDTVIVDGYGVNKKISQGDSVVEFVANKAGEFRMHCANDMGNGKLIVQ